MPEPLPIVLLCADLLLPKVRYVFDSLFMATGIPVAYSSEPPSSGPWLLYGPGIDPHGRLIDASLSHTALGHGDSLKVIPTSGLPPASTA